MSRHGAGESVAGTHADDVASFLVDADEEVAASILLEGGAEFAELVWGFHVAVACTGGSVVFEEDDAADMVLLNIADDVAFRADGGAAEAYEEHFADVFEELLVGVFVAYGDDFRLLGSVLSTG